MTKTVGLRSRSKASAAAPTSAAVEVDENDLAGGASSATGTPTTADAASGGTATAREQRTAKLRQHSLSSVRKLQELLHECNVQLATFRNAIQNIGTTGDGPQLRKEIDNSARACVRSFPILGVEFTRHASQFIGCVSACVVEMKRCEALEETFPGDATVAAPHIENMEQMLETLENLITVHYSTSEVAPADKVAPRRRRGATCRPQCVCSKLKTSYA
ncbi:hypothetical protein FO519_006433 [Halicephalobus sp. NKZ332]|nr:hypothetical protein FO519_006433 [Halicephalobus sp. NKZ332]